MMNSSFYCLNVDCQARIALKLGRLLIVSWVELHFCQNNFCSASTVHGKILIEGQDSILAHNIPLSKIEKTKEQNIKSIILSSDQDICLPSWYTAQCSAPTYSREFPQIMKIPGCNVFKPFHVISGNKYWTFYAHTDFVKEILQFQEIQINSRKSAIYHACNIHVYFTYKSYTIIVCMYVWRWNVSHMMYRTSSVQKK